jgi:hydroxyquinol 1,2-dioxygenase
MREFDEQSITAAVLARMDQCEDARFKQVMTSLVKHLHGFVREVRLTDAEWFGAIQFLTDVGKTCTEKRQEYILLSDTLGVSILVITLNHPASGGATDSTVQGPYYWEGAPELPNGANLAVDVKGEPAFYSGRVLSSDGTPIAGALLDVWSGDGEGTYDMQMEGDVGMKARGRIRTDAQGRYSFRSIKPEYYPVPTDGPVGIMLRRMGRHPMRPGHIHMIVSAPGHHAITTHLFAAGSEYIDSDAVFGVKESLVTPYAKHPPGTAPDGTQMGVAYYTVNFDFKLQRQ